MLTNFGKALRKIRIENDELLKDMASKLNVTVAYLSAVENGNREVPDSWIDILSKAYDLTIDEKRQIQSYAYEKKENLKICLSDINQDEKELALAFARTFKELSDEDRKKLKSFFER